MKRSIICLCALLVGLFFWASMIPTGYAAGTAPVAENLELKTYRNVSVGGALSAYDPEGGALHFTLTTKPRKGELLLQEDGSFVYTPERDRKGRDYFGYKVMDDEGLLSQEATVIIRIEKQKSDVSYVDMEGNPYEYAAVALAEQGIFVGKQIGGSYCFSPEEEISRGEFIGMCMSMLQIPQMPGNLPSWEQPLHTSEAASILNQSLGIRDVSYRNLEQSLSRPEAQACANLEAYGILRQGEALLENISRCQAADMLCKAMIMTGR